MSSKLKNSFSELNESVKQYLQVKTDLLKLLILKKATNFLGFIFGLVLIILLSTLIVAFAGAVFVIWYGLTFNNYLTGMLIFTGFLLIVLVIFLLIMKKMLTSFFLSNISVIIFEEDDD